MKCRTKTEESSVGSFIRPYFLSITCAVLCDAVIRSFGFGIKGRLITFVDALHEKYDEHSHSAGEAGRYTTRISAMTENIRKEVKDKFDFDYP